MLVFGRIFFLLLAILGTFTASWFFVLAVLSYAIARYNWYLEAVLCAIILDFLSGMFFGHFLVPIFAIIFLAEYIKPFFQERNTISIFGISFLILTLIFIFNAAFFILASTFNLYGYINFGQSLLAGAIYSYIILILITALSIIIKYIFK